MAISRRSFLGAAGLGIGGLAASSLIRPRRARAAGNGFRTKRVVIVAVAGGIRIGESLGMAEGATMPNMLGTTPLVTGYAEGPQDGPRIAPEYEAAARRIVTPTPLARPLFEEGTLITNVRYAEGAPGHLQGHGCLVSGMYNNLENRSDARLPAPTLFELHRRQANAPATDAWYVSVLGGFYRSLQTSDHPDFGARFAGSYLSPPGAMSPLVPLATSGVRRVDVGSGGLPAIPFDPAEDQAARALTAMLDGNTRDYEPDSAAVRAAVEENAALQNHVAQFYADRTYDGYYPADRGIGLDNDEGGVDQTPDALTLFHTERILETFKPAVTVVSLIDVDVAHDDFNGYLRNQLIADAAIADLWQFIQSTEGLRDETALIVIPEHGRHLFMNNNNPDSFGRSGIDHGQGDDGDRDVWMLALGPDFKRGHVAAPTGITQTGRASGRYETIDAIMTASCLLGHDEVMTRELSALGARPGLVIEEALA